MTPLNLLKFSTTLLCTIVIVPKTTGQLVKFYEKMYLEGFLYEAQAKESCTALPMEAQNKTRSMLTEECIMLFDGLSCDSYSFKVLPPRTTAVPHVIGVTWGNTIRIDPRVSSFRLCSKFERGEENKLDVYMSRYYTDLGMEYNNVCGCVNLPSNLSNSLGSIDNHGMCFNFFSTRNCEGSSAYYSMGGKNRRSEDLKSYRLSQMMSFQPCDLWNALPLSCPPRLKAVAYEFKILPSVEGMIEEIELAPKTILQNNGTKNIIKEYNVNNSIETAFKIYKSHILSRFSILWLDYDVVNDINAGVELDANVSFAAAKASISTFLKSSFENMSETSETVFATEVLKEYVISEKVVIPDCTEYQVSSFVKVLKDADIPFWIYLRVSGRVADKEMLAAEIEEELNRLDITAVGYYDAHTVVAKVNWSMRATLGLETYNTTYRATIQDCLETTTRKSVASSSGASINDDWTVLETLKFYIFCGISSLIVDLFTNAEVRGKSKQTSF